MTDSSTGRPTDLPKAYLPADFETAIYERWLAADVFAPDGTGSRADASKPPFVIVQPPPNVTGALHIGHALTADLEDVMIRRARMLRRPTLWLPGLDHASIGAQVVLDKLIAAEGESRASLGRERYLERMNAFVEETRQTILRQSRRFGSSLDWSRTRFTMDEVSSKAVRSAFTRLYRDGLAYRTEALINWCPGCRTSVSDLEVIPTPETGTIWTIRYHLLDAAGRPDPARTIAVATTRPETILGDVAVAVHPDDPRYAVLVGERVLIPFVDRSVPIIADAVVQPDFGTGAVKITPAHDPDDHATGARHGLAAISVMDDDASLNAAAGPYAGLDRYEARERILTDLAARGDLVESKPHEMIIGRCQRSNDVIEPRLKTQWFIRTKPLAARALEATRSGRTTILPERFVKVWEHWLTEIRDWNISRQLWWGHRIPAWYCPDGHVTVSDRVGGPSACDVCGRPAAELVQDDDIFDTWFSSGLWPFSTLGWPDDTADLRRFYPGTVMETGYDIIFFWVARMMMLGIHFLDEAPFETVYLHGLVRAGTGAKMSKTVGNVVDPLDAIDEIGADALRFALIHGISAGADQKFSREKLENARNFGNKLWNAARFVLGARPTSVSADAPRVAPDRTRLGPSDRWLGSRMAATVAGVERAMDGFAFGEATRLLYDMTWSAYCDWGLEFAKVRLADPTLTDAEREATWWALVEVLDGLLRLLHPFLPHLTEAIWAASPHDTDDPELLIVADWPDPTAWSRLADEPSERAVDRVRELISEVRNARSTAKITAAERRPGDVLVPSDLWTTFADLVPAIGRMARLEPLVAHADREAFAAADRAGSLTVIAGELEARIAAGGVDPAADLAERTRLERELSDAERHLAAARARLANEAFRAKAPPAVVEGARASEAELADQVGRLRARLSD